MSGESQDFHFRDQCLDDALNITILETVLLSSQSYFHVGSRDGCEYCTRYLASCCNVGYCLS